MAPKADELPKAEDWPKTGAGFPKAAGWVFPKRLEPKPVPPKAILGQRDEETNRSPIGGVPRMLQRRHRALYDIVQYWVHDLCSGGGKNCICPSTIHTDGSPLTFGKIRVAFAFV